MEHRRLKIKKDTLKYKWYAAALIMFLVGISLLAFTNVSEKHSKYKTPGVITIQDRNAELKMEFFDKEKSFDEPQYGNPLRHLFLVELGLDN